MATTTLDKSGNLSLPEAVRKRMKWDGDTELRIVETSLGVLLVPQRHGDFTPEERAEFEQWQSAYADSWAIFPYETDDEAA
jgi:bifunctional DNA-binding transcriptional regulator/antitoxin component of YhaV-PrlF toxin-antitoxin module